MSHQVELAEQITARAADHDANLRAAVRLVRHSILLRKIGPYVEADGWIDWPRLASDLIHGLPWSSGELRVGRIACSLSGLMPYFDVDDLTPDVLPWTLAQLLYGLDDANREAVLDAVHYAMTGRPFQRGSFS